MARRKHRRRRSYGDYISVPTFGSMKEYNPLGKSVNSTDVFLGMGVALAGGSIVKMAAAKVSDKLPEVVTKYIAPISSVLAGVAAYMLMRKKKAHKAQGILVGSILTGVTPLVWTGLQKVAPQFFADYVSVPLGMLTRDAGGLGTLTRDFAGDEDWDPMSAP